MFACANFDTNVTKYHKNDTASIKCGEAVETCSSNDTALRTVILNKCEKSFIDKAVKNNNEPNDDVKCGNEHFSNYIKEEIKAELDIISDIKLNEEDKVHSENCSLNFHSFIDKAVERGNEPYIDVKSENEQVSSDSNYFSNDVKEEIITEPDISYIKLNEEEKVICGNCSLNFPDRLRLYEHYKEISNCQPIDFDEAKASVLNIVDYFEKGENKDEQKLRNKQKGSKLEDDEEPEYLKGRKLKDKKRFLCSYCGKDYTRKNGLERHILTHTGVKPFECKECGKRFIRKCTLENHILTHTGVKAHKCTVCQKLFTQSGHLSDHMRRHSGEKPFSCTFCGKGFLSNYRLQRHKLMHTGVKPFECEQCGKHFVRGTTLRDHLLIHSREKRFQCQPCGEKFTKKQSLINHVVVCWNVN